MVVIYLAYIDTDDEIYNRTVLVSADGALLGVNYGNILGSEDCTVLSIVDLKSDGVDDGIVLGIKDRI